MIGNSAMNLSRRDRRGQSITSYPLMFHPDPNVNDAGTGLVKEIDIAPAFLVERFGPPLCGDGNRCTGRYKFVGNDGATFTVYEYKSTAAYLDDEDALPPEQFWRSRDAQELSIGGR